MELSIVRLFADKILMNLSVGFFPVIIVCIDNDKRLIENFFRCKNCLTGSPWLGAAFRLFETVRKIFQFLERIFYFCDFLNSFSNDMTEFLLQILPDNKNHFIKSGLQRIMDGILHDHLSVRAHRRKLFNSFSEAASDSCRHDHKCCFLHNVSFLLLRIRIILHPVSYLILQPGLPRSGCL